jgi:hypothetical protein
MQPPARFRPPVTAAYLEPADAADPERYLAHIAHRFVILRPGLTPCQAADTAWVIASPESYELLVRRAGLTTADLERWDRTTLTAALLA